MRSAASAGVSKARTSKIAPAKPDDRDLSPVPSISASIAWMSRHERSEVSDTGDAQPGRSDQPVGWSLSISIRLAWRIAAGPKTCRRAGSTCGVRGKCRQCRSPRCGCCARCLGNPAARQRWAQCSHRLQLRGNTWPCGRGRTDDRVARSRRRSNRRRGACDSSATLGKRKNGSGDRASPMIVRAAYRCGGS